MDDVNRRDFVKTVAASSAAAAMTGALFSPTARAQGANSRLRVASIGLGGRGTRILTPVVRASEKADLVALCDPDQQRLDKTEPDDSTSFRTQDLREILDRNDIDCIVSATPNHWHGLLTVWGCQAGKHVYIEKPISHNILESEAIVKASRKYNKIVQGGFQNRSDTGLIPFMERLHAGEFGAVTSVYGTCNRPRKSIGKNETPYEVPNHIHYDMWLGPAQDEPIYRGGLHYNWHWRFNTGNGDIGNQSPHELDLMLWALGDPEELPQKFRVAGGRFGWHDSGETPNVLACSGEINGIPFGCEVQDLKHGRGAPYRKTVGVIIRTEKGVFVGGRGGGRYVGHDGKNISFGRTRSGSQLNDGGGAHIENFFDAVLTDDRTIQRSEAAVAARASNIGHIANIGFMLGEEAPAETLEKAFSGSMTDRDLIARMRESVLLYSIVENQCAPTVPWLLGPELTFDTKTMAFTGNKAKQANALLSREYRKGFELPVL